MTKELIAKLEALEGPDVGAFCEVFNFIHPQPVLQCCEIGDNWQHKHYKYLGLINHQAWESAAIMLVPEGWEYTMDQRHQEAILARSNCYGREEWHEKAEHKHPAIALLICILKAKEPVE